MAYPPHPGESTPGLAVYLRSALPVWRGERILMLKPQLISGMRDRPTGRPFRTGRRRKFKGAVLLFRTAGHADRVGDRRRIDCPRERAGALPQPADPHRRAVRAGRLCRYHGSPAGAEAHRTHQRPGRDREPPRRRWNHRRHRRHLGGTGRLHPVRVLERHRAVEIAAQVDAVRSGHRVRADLDHGAVRPAAAGAERTRRCTR